MRSAARTMPVMNFFISVVLLSPIMSLMASYMSRKIKAMFMRSRMTAHAMLIPVNPAMVPDMFMTVVFKTKSSMFPASQRMSAMIPRMV